MKRLSFLVLLSTLLPFALSKSWHLSLTVRVDPGMTDCFFMSNIREGHEIEVDYEVIDSGSAVGNLDINVDILDPQKNSLHNVLKESDGDFSGTAKVDGDYEVCLDNSYSTFSSKDVTVDFYINDPEDDYYDDYIEDEDMEAMKRFDLEDTELEMTVEEIHESLHTIRTNVRRLSHYQSMMLSSHTQDIKMSQKNSEKVTMWSLVHVSFLVAIMLVQTCMVKNLFSDKSFIYKITRWQ